MAIFCWERLNPNYQWYLAGLITSDGCLYNDGRHINITSAERDYLELVKFLCLLPHKINRKYNGQGKPAYQIQIGSVSYFRFLSSIGLMPNKSKKLAVIDVPEEYFCEFLRGVIDGDGCIRRWIHTNNGKEQWSLRIYSGSLAFVEWLHQRIASQLGAMGRISREKTDVYVLKFGKMAGIRICRKCYIESDSFLHLKRKYLLAHAMVTTKGGWSQSKTVVSPGGGIGRR